MFLLGFGSRAYCEDLCTATCKGCNVLLISFDTLRADALGAYGNPKGFTPGIDSLAANSILFKNAYSTSPKTATSHMSIFTSLTPNAHGVRNAKSDSKSFAPLPEPIETVTQVLKRHNYLTVGFHGGGHVDKEFGFARGFDIYEYADRPRERSVVRWLKQRESQKPSGQPFFLFFHTYEMHSPYLVPQEIETSVEYPYSGRIALNEESLYRLNNKPLNKSWDWFFLEKAFWERVDPESKEDIAYLRHAYDMQAVAVDRMFSAIYAALGEARKRTIIIVLSDHGEEFKEHGEFSHEQLYRELLHVPLIVKHPFCNHGKPDHSVSTLDVAPTILKMLSLPVPQQFQGKSLFDISADRARIFAASYLGKKQHTLFTNQEKIIAQRSWSKPDKLDWMRVYDLAKDPLEKSEILKSSARRNRLGNKLLLYLKQQDDLNKVLRNAAAGTSETGLESKEKELPPHLIEELKALGYIQ